jgi:transcriptional regulator with XRE-family HTH domain
MSEVDIGARIRERRLELRLRQADLARQIGISASYLNLIEHNRRRIGGKVLVKIAQALEVEPLQLTQGAEADLVAVLRAVQADSALQEDALDRAEEFATKFPSWAQVTADLHEKLGILKQIIDSLNNRLAHDPDVASALHEVLSTAAAIKSTAAILTETPALEPEWLDRFHANIGEDSNRLAQSSRLLAEYLERLDDKLPDYASPQQEVDRFIEGHGYNFPALEPNAKPDSEIENFCQNTQLSAPAKFILSSTLTLYKKDAARLPLQKLRKAMEGQLKLDPLHLAQVLHQEPSLVLRRLAALPELNAGLVCADRAGYITLRKSIPGFSLPSLGAVCPLWLVFDALLAPGQFLYETCTQLGPVSHRFDCYAAAQTEQPSGYNQPPAARAVMLILPAASGGQASREIGSSCVLCQKSSCSARRVMSVL